jgi:predicted exporter
MTKRICLWLFLLLMAASLWRVLFHVQVQTDITGFMPEARTQVQRLLVQQLENGAAAGLWIVVLSGAPEEVQAEVSRKLSEYASRSSLVNQVWNGQQGLPSVLRDKIFSYRYLLSKRIVPDSYSSEGLRKMFEDLLQNLRSPLSAFSKQLAIRDPGGEGLYLFEKLRGQSSKLMVRNGVWFSKNAPQAILLLQSSASGTDLDAQQHLSDQLQKWFAESKSAAGIADLQMNLGGVPVISLQTRAQIRDTSRILSMAATAFMLLFMFMIYRSPVKVILTALPLLSGTLVAVSLVSWWFGSIHGITLAFGIVLLGVAVDYPVHILSHQREGESLTKTVKRIRGTLLLGVVSSVLGFSAMLWTDFNGLAQLGLFAMSGLLVAAWTSMNINPVLAGETYIPPVHWPVLPGRPLGTGWSGLLVLAIVMIAVAVVQDRDIWAKDIQSLSPVSAQTKKADQQLRELTAAADPGLVLLVVADTVQEVLEKQEQLAPRLQKAVDQGYMLSTDYAAAILPSIKFQRQRQRWIPNLSVLEHNMTQALQGLPFRPGSFASFIDELQQSHQLAPLVEADLRDSPLELRLQSLLQNLGERYVGLVSLNGVKQKQKLQDWLAADSLDDVWLLDIPEASSHLVDEFRKAIINRILLVLALIALMVLIWLRDAERWLRVMLPVLLSMLVAATTVLLGGSGLNLFHLVSLLLVAGIGLDYALFFSRPVTDSKDRGHTQMALMVCAISTVVVFLLLAFSEIPVLQAIGVTVTTGTVSAFLLSWFIAGSENVSVTPSKEIR